MYLFGGRVPFFFFFFFFGVPRSELLISELPDFGLPDFRTPGFRAPKFGVPSFGIPQVRSSNFSTHEFDCSGGSGVGRYYKKVVSEFLSSGVPDLRNLGSSGSEASP